LKIVKYLLIFLFFCFAQIDRSGGQTVQTGESRTYTDPGIHTVLFFPEGLEFSLPVIELGRLQRLILKFDELSRNPKNYHYTLVHCDAGWNPSRLTTAEYMEGFSENPINDYAFSINTTIPFVNYRLILPNDNVRILVSGNYLLKIWEDDNKEKPVLIRPFYVTEKEVDISGEIHRASYEGFNGESQQVACAVNFPRLTLVDPMNEITSVVMQNGRSDNRRTKIRPTFIRQNQLVYEDKAELFKGGNEFRNFNAKNIQTNGMGVHSVEYRDPFFHLFLEKDQSFAKEMYRAWDDLNGSYLVKNDRAADSDLESDYVWVHFSLAPSDQVTNDLVYVFGALSEWQCLPKNQMKFNPETKSYEVALLLKQGFYDYQYVQFDPDKKTVDASFFEGSHIETENDYHFFVYYRGFSARYDRLIGYRLINSVKR
jgi:hypothetical protein